MRQHTFLIWYRYNALRKRFGDAAMGTILLVSPQVYEPQDGPARDELFWDASSAAARNWKWGGNSSATLRASISSFSVLDELLHTMLDPSLYPNLAQLVVAGHSAGGPPYEEGAPAM